jgi:hypothetical protein
MMRASSGISSSPSWPSTGYCKLEKELKKTGLLQRFSPTDVLEEFSKVYLFTDGTREVVSEIPRKVAELEAKLGVDVFPK